MSISSQVAKTGPVLISALPQTIPVGFPFQTGTDLLVLDYGASAGTNDPAKVLVFGSDYSVGIGGGGYNSINQMQTGSIVVVSGGSSSVAVNDLIVISRNVPVNQTQSFASTGPATITLLEQGLDKQATISQELLASSAQALQLENWETQSGILNYNARKGLLLGFDASGVIQFYAPGVVSASFTNPTFIGTITLPSGQTLIGSGATNVFSGNQQIGGTLAVTGASTLTGLVTASGGILGKTSAGAAAGNIGEWMQAEAVDTTVSLVDSTTVNFFGVSTAALTLTPGDWDVGGSGYFLLTSATATLSGVGFKATTASSPANSQIAVNFVGCTTYTKLLIYPIPVQRWTVTVNTPLYMNGFLQFSAGSATAGGFAWARRSASAGQ